MQSKKQNDFNKTTGQFVSPTRYCLRCYTLHSNPLMRLCEKCEDEVKKEFNILFKK
jgi:hypothetical protein